MFTFAFCKIQEAVAFESIGTSKSEVRTANLTKKYTTCKQIISAIHVGDET
jgi:hypothetical protein